MSSAWHWPDSENKVGASSGQGMTPNTDRSRSPPATSAPSRSGLHKEHPQAILPEQVRAEAAAATCAPSWSTGLQQCDDWLRTHIVDDEVLCSFSEIPERNRKTIVLKAISQPKDNPVAWIAACVNNQRTRDLRNKLTSMASSPGGRSPTVQSAGPSKVGLTSPGTMASSGSPYSSACGSPRAGHAPSAPASLERRLSHAEQPLDQEPAMLAWAAETWSSGAANKSALIRAVHATLAGDSLRYFRELPPAIQASFATVWVFACPSHGPRAHEQMLSWLSRYRAVAACSSPAPCLTTGPSIQCQCLSIQVIIIGCTAGYQYTILEAVCKLATLRDSSEYNLLPVLCCCADQHTTKVSSILASQRSFVPINKVLTESELASDVGAYVNRWSMDLVKVLIVTTLPLNIMQFAKQGDPEAVLHSPSARHIWFSQTLSARIMSVLGQTAVIDVTIAPFNLALEARSLLERSVGPLVSQAVPQDAMQASQQVLVFSNVTVAQLGLANMRVPDARGPIDGWRWSAGESAEVSKAPMYIFRTLPMLLCTRMFNERALTSEEEDIVLMASIEHEPTKERRFASRAFMERWLGIEGTHFSTALQSTCPCSRWILPVTGEATEETALGESCDASRYCLGCEDVFATLSLVPAMHIVCPLVASVFSAGLRDWRSGSVQAWVIRDLTSQHHSCNAQCPRNPRVGR